jgi:hypothetical protein
MSFYLNATAFIILKTGFTPFRKWYLITKEKHLCNHGQSNQCNIEQGKMGWLKATKIFNVPQATLRCQCEGKKILAKDVTKNWADTSLHFIQMKKQLYNMF